MIQKRFYKDISLKGKSFESTICGILDANETILLKIKIMLSLIL